VPLYPRRFHPDEIMGVIGEKGIQEILIVDPDRVCAKNHCPFTRSKLLIGSHTT